MMTQDEYARLVKLTTKPCRAEYLEEAVRLLFYIVARESTDVSVSDDAVQATDNINDRLRTITDEKVVERLSDGGTAKTVSSTL